MVYEISEGKTVESLFDGWRETLIWSCLQGVMGRIYADSVEKPSAAMALLGDFCFLTGEPDRELASYRPQKKDFLIVVPQNDQWAELIEDCYGEKAKRVVRYAIKKEPDIFHRQSLQKAVEELEPGYELRMIDEELFRRCMEIPWCRDFVSQYKDYATYEKYGLGVVALKDGELVSGASSYSGYIGGIEVEIDTREDFRRKGLAYTCGAKLILECLEKGLYPSWDAQNTWSVALAQKLGYHFSHEYGAYEIYWDPV